MKLSGREIGGLSRQLFVLLWRWKTFYLKQALTTLFIIFDALLQLLHGDNDNMQRGGGGRDREAPYDSRDGVTGFKGLPRGHHITAAKVPHEKFGRG